MKTPSEVLLAISVAVAHIVADENCTAAHEDVPAVAPTKGLEPDYLDYHYNRMSQGGSTPNGFAEDGSPIFALAGEPGVFTAVAGKQGWVFEEVEGLPRYNFVDGAWVTINPGEPGYEDAGFTDVTTLLDNNDKSGFTIRVIR